MRPLLILCSTALALSLSNVAFAANTHTAPADTTAKAPPPVATKGAASEKKKSAGKNPAWPKSRAETVSVTATRDARVVSPSSVSLDAVQPESQVSNYYITHAAPPTSDYLTLVQFTPSVSNSSPNGPGVSSKNATIRGFQDGEYNVTFDGIPFGDPNSYGHATTSFFPAPVVSTVSVDRGPGTASTIGNATFGGSMNIKSAALSDKMGGMVGGSMGSNSTYQSVIELQTGRIEKTNGTRLMFNYSHTETAGMVNYGGLRQDNYFAKLEQPLGANTTLTLVGEKTGLDWYTYSQPTLASTALYGYSFANLNNDPNSQQYYKYALDQRGSDFSYMDLKSENYGFRFDNKLYTYALDNLGSGAADNKGTTDNSALLTTGVPGALEESHYRAYGDIARLEHDFGHGFFSTTARVGVWWEHARESVTEYTVNLQTGLPAVFTGYPNAKAIDLLSDSETIQSFVEFAWHPVKGLTITPGWKHVDFHRHIAGETSFEGVNNSSSYAVDLGSTSINYHLTKNVSIYSQWAMGFQAPQANTQEATGSAYNTLSPQQTINYQAGIVYKSGRLVASLDGYYINFRNKIGSFTESSAIGGGNVTVYRNQGGVIYKGIEAEATYQLGYGLSLTANGSINSAAAKTTDLQIANAPSATANFGAIYDHGRLYGSILTKWVGHRFAGDGQLASGANYTRLPAYSYTNLTLGYRFPHGVRVDFQANNLFNNRTITEGSGAATNTTYYYLAQRNFYGTVRISF